MTGQLILDCFVTKRCSRCREEKGAEAFPRNRRGTYGLSCYCRECTTIRTKKYYQANRERVLAYPSRKYDPVAYKQWYAENRHKRHARYEASDKARHLENGRRWREANREKLRALQMEWRNQNRDRWNNYNYLRRARREASQIINFTVEQLAERWAYYADKCWVCGAAATETDHVKPLSKGGSHMLCNLRPVCKPCNLSKAAKWPFPVRCSWITERRTA